MDGWKGVFSVQANMECFHPTMLRKLRLKLTTMKYNFASVENTQLPYTHNIK